MAYRRKKAERLLKSYNYGTRGQAGGEDCQKENWKGVSDANVV